MKKTKTKAAAAKRPPAKAKKAKGPKKKEPKKPAPAKIGAKQAAKESKPSRVAPSVAVALTPEALGELVHRLEEVGAAVLAVRQQNKDLKEILHKVWADTQQRFLALGEVVTEIADEVFGDEEEEAAPARADFENLPARDDDPGEPEGDEENDGAFDLEEDESADDDQIEDTQDEDPED